MDIIIRKFTIPRGASNQTYPFTTFSCILNQTPEAPLTGLFEYMKRIFLEGIPSTAGHSSVSGAPLLQIPTVQRVDSDLVQFTKDSNCTGRGKFQHEVLQEHLINNDHSCLATEVPVYDSEFLGHIDIVRFREGRIEVADYKPNAHKEKKAASQITRYRQLLSKNTKIPESLIDIIYFDDRNAYTLILK